MPNFSVICGVVKFEIITDKSFLAEIENKFSYLRNENTFRICINIKKSFLRLCYDYEINPRLCVCGGISNPSFIINPKVGELWRSLIWQENGFNIYVSLQRF